MPQVKSKVTKNARGPVSSVSFPFGGPPSSLHSFAAGGRREPSSLPPLAKRSSRKPTGLSISVYSLSGRAAGTLALPKEIFGAKVNKNLLAQAMRVYLTNQKAHWSSTKTRAEVRGSTRKIWRQKGTGRARHGARSAPIFVGGGVALGPKPRKTILDLPKKMRHKALLSALAQKMTDQEVLGLSGLEKSTGKTKEVVSLMNKLAKKSALIVSDKRLENAQRAIRNLPGINLMSVDQVNAFEVIKHQSLILTKEAVERLQERLGGKNAS